MGENPPLPKAFPLLPSVLPASPPALWPSPLLLLTLSLRSPVSFSVAVAVAVPALLRAGSGRPPRSLLPSPNDIFQRTGLDLNLDRSDRPRTDREIRCPPGIRRFFVNAHCATEQAFWFADACCIAFGGVLQAGGRRFESDHLHSKIAWSVARSLNHALASVPLVPTV